MTIWRCPAILVLGVAMDAIATKLAARYSSEAQYYQHFINKLADKLAAKLANASVNLVRMVPASCHTDLDSTALSKTRSVKRDRPAQSRAPSPNHTSAFPCNGSASPTPRNQATAIASEATEAAVPMTGRVAVMLSNSQPADTATAAEVIESANFNWTEELQALSVSLPRINALKRDKELQPFLYKGKNVVKADYPNRKLVLLAPGIDRDNLPESIRTEYNETLPYNIQHGYKDLSKEEALGRVLPKELGMPSLRATRIGHLAHVKLKRRFKPYRFLIGKIMLDKDKNPVVKTVVASVDTVSKNEFRNFDLEVIGGKNCTEVSVKENGFILNFDFGNVYWNPCFANERLSLLSQVKSHDVVCDLFAGVGAFAIFCAGKGCKVLSNDLNPIAADTQRRNARLNKVKMEVLNLDARACVKELEARPPLTMTVDPGANGGCMPRIFVIMRFPGMALQFLDVFREAVVGGRNKLFSSSNFTLTIRCYCFADAEFPEKEIYPALVDALGVVPMGTVVREVRDVALTRKMHRVDFDVPAVTPDGHAEPEFKRRRREESFELGRGPENL